jgi:hypothetical protein
MHAARIAGQMFDRMLAFTVHRKLVPDAGREPDIRCAEHGGLLCGTKPTLAATGAMTANGLDLPFSHYPDAAVQLLHCGHSCTAQHFVVFIVSQRTNLTLTK